jgi:dephospho-CoA kinase
MGRMARIVALSGGIGTGKSTVAAMLRELGAVVIDADALVREVQEPGSLAIDEIVEAFGPGIVRQGGELDREKLGALVFRDPEARKRLEAIVHPRVRALMARRIQEAQASGATLIVLDIPLLFEGGRRGFETTILVYAPEALQIERQVARNGYGRDEALRRVRAQMPIEEKRKLADFVVDNSGSLEETRRQVHELYARLVGA